MLLMESEIGGAGRARRRTLARSRRAQNRRDGQEVPMTGVRLPNVRMRGRLLEGFV
jgi:hypothetical protein